MLLSSFLLNRLVEFQEQSFVREAHGCSPLGETGEGSQGRQHFPQIHYIIRIDRLFDGTHHSQCPSPMFRVHIFLFPDPNAMLTGNGSAHC